MDDAVGMQVAESLEDLAQVDDAQLFGEDAVFLDEAGQRARVNVLEDKVQMMGRLDHVAKGRHVGMMQALHQLSLGQHPLLLRPAPHLPA